MPEKTKVLRSATASAKSLSVSAAAKMATPAEPSAHETTMVPLMDANDGNNRLADESSSQLASRESPDRPAQSTPSVEKSDSAAVISNKSRTTLAKQLFDDYDDHDYDSSPEDPESNQKHDQTHIDDPENVEEKSVDPTDDYTTTTPPKRGTHPNPNSPTPGAHVHNSSITFQDEDRPDPPTMQDQLTKVATTLDSINDKLNSLSDSFHNLETTNIELKGELSTFRTKATNEMETTKVSFAEKLESLEFRIFEDQQTKHDNLTEDFKTHTENTTSVVSSLKKKLSTEATTIGNLRGTVVHQQERILNLETKVSRLEILETRLDEYIANNSNRSTVLDGTMMDHLEKKLNDHIEATTSKFLSFDDRIKEARAIANDVEAHGRRWSVRLVGLDAPTRPKESPDEAKDVALQFFATYLDIKDIMPEQIDTAHRIGAVKNHKQTLMIRFFRRELAEYVLKNKRVLKGKEKSIFEDSPRLHRDLLFKLSKRAEVEQAWNMGGSVWVKLHATTRKFKVSINDDLDVVLKPKHRATHNQIQTTVHTTDEIPHSTGDPAHPTTSSSNDQSETPHVTTPGSNPPRTTIASSERPRSNQNSPPPYTVVEVDNSVDPTKVLTQVHVNPSPGNSTKENCNYVPPTIPLQA